ncbi:MAG: hypothetical protein AB8G99_22625 [Planctomycetaceae bacterium]
MRVVVVINRFAELTGRQTTAMLIAAFVTRGHDVFVAEVEGLSVRDGASGIECNCDVVPVLGSSLDSEHVVTHLKSEGVETIQLTVGDFLFLRTNPGRDPERSREHDRCLQLASVALSLGVRVLNRPDQLNRFASKASLFELDAPFRPAGIVTSSIEQLLGFAVERDTGCVVKPLMGSRGRDVVRLTRGDSHAVDAATEVMKRGPVVCQEFVDWDQPGDVRLVVLNGEPLTVDGTVAAIHRVPAEGEFRANLHMGGTAQPITPDAPMLAAATHAAQLLNQHGIWLAGIDLIGSKIIETNVFSTGGLFDAERFYEHDFVGRIADQAFGHDINATS